MSHNNPANFDPHRRQRSYHDTTSDHFYGHHHQQEQQQHSVDPSAHSFYEGHHSQHASTYSNALLESQSSASREYSAYLNANMGGFTYSTPPAPNVAYDYYEPSSYLTHRHPPQAEEHLTTYAEWGPPVDPDHHHPTLDLYPLPDDVPAGSYYPIPGWVPPLWGAPVTSIAFDSLYAAMYISSATQNVASSGPSQRHRASLLVTHSTLDGSVFASVAGHPQAPSAVLTAMYPYLFGGAVTEPTPSLPSSPRNRPSHPTTPAASQPPHHIPNHAYRPPYAKIDPALPDTTAQINYQWGIHSLVATEGYVASVSPSAVRVHAHGGLQLADHHLEGLMCGTLHPTLDGSHLTVGGLVLPPAASSLSATHSSTTTNTTAQYATRPGSQSERHKSTTNRHELLCMDIWSGLRVVSSATLGPRRSEDGGGGAMAVTALATSHSKGSIVAGCSDGQLRLYDGRLKEVAKIKSHAGGVVQVAVSDDGMILATTGYSSRTHRTAGTTHTPWYGYPDPTVLLYDVRYLGRGGFPHPFAGMRGGPRFLSFLPSVGDQPTKRLLIASGQVGGGLQIITPFQQDDHNAGNFIVPALEHDEAISAMSVGDDDLALGTSQGRLLRFKMAGFVNRPEKRPLEMPPFHPPLPALSLEPALLQLDDKLGRPGPNERIRSLTTAYLLTREPTVSAIDDGSGITTSSFGALEHAPLLPQSRLQVAARLLGQGSQPADYFHTVPTAELGINPLEDHRPTRTWQQQRNRTKTEPLANPNKFLYTKKIFDLAYEESLNMPKRLGKRSEERHQEDESGEEVSQVDIPSRYRLTLRQTHKLNTFFSRSDFNKSGLFPGWDYPPSMPNAFVSPLLMMLYFVPEVRACALGAQASDGPPPPGNTRERSLIQELGYLYHRIETIARYAMIFPTDSVNSSMITRLEPWAPTSFVSCLSTIPEAERLQILDGSPEAVPTARRPEAFHRFLLYQIDKELAKSSSGRLLENLGGIDFVSINEFISGSGPLNTSITRALTAELSYEPFVGKGGIPAQLPHFGEVLQQTLSRETRLRAWNQSSKAYETIVQRKVATSLPQLLSLAAGCAGRKEEEGMFLWRGGVDGTDHWVPEMIEIELESNGTLCVRELVRDSRSGGKTWKEFRGPGSHPEPIAKIIGEMSTSASRFRRYRLDAVICMVRDDTDKVGSDKATGHHVLHVRVPRKYKQFILAKQQQEIEKYLAEPVIAETTGCTLIGLERNNDILQNRLEYANQRVAENNSSDDGDDEWMIFNGYVVAETLCEDARAFHVKFKEPSLLMFRAIEASDDSSLELGAVPEMAMHPDVIKTVSIGNATKSPYAAHQKPNALPEKGDIVAFDAEFVSVQEEESTLAANGSKLTIRETRHAVARISVIDCRNKQVIFDDHVIPDERVVDYLTRFSGIVPSDLDARQSRRHLISARSAYLKLRYLMERGCIFVGHGLQQDFWTLNLAVPASQIIDTVELYHKPAQRYISLRFLTNFVLHRDMQQDVHDSVEDALAAFELYAQALEFMRSGDFQQLLEKLYQYGQRTDWKLGVVADDNDDSKDVNK